MSVGVIIMSNPNIHSWNHLIYKNIFMMECWQKEYKIDDLCKERSSCTAVAIGDTIRNME